MEKILVTGGAGFIGSHIVDLLINKGYDIVVIDDLSKGNIFNINRRAKFYKLDILSGEIEKVFEREKFFAVIHQAAKVSLRKSLIEPLEDATSNILGTINILDCCRKFNVKKIIYAASASRYGFPLHLPCDENHPVNPISPYALSKYAAENYMKLYSKLYGVKYTILVYPNIYGPRQNLSEEGGVIPIFINALLNNSQPKIFGSGLQTRDFVYVDDIAFANYLALINRNAENKTFNLGSGNEVSINNLYGEIKKILSSDIKPAYKQRTKGEVGRISLSNQLVEQELNFKPTTCLNEGLKKTIEYYHLPIN